MNPAMAGRRMWDRIVKPQSQATPVAVRQTASTVLVAKVTTAVIAIVYAAGLTLSHRNEVSPLFSYLQFEWHWSSLSTYMLGLAPAVLSALAIQGRGRQPSDMVVWILWVTVICPLPTLGPIMFPRATVPALLAGWAAAAALVFVDRVAHTDIGFHPLANRRPSPRAFTAALVGVALLNSAILISVFGFSTSLVRLDQIEEVRLASRSTFAQTNVLVTYILSWQAAAINPAILVLGLIRRRPALVVLASVMQVIAFNATAQKSFLFGFVLILGVFALTGLRQGSPWRLHFRTFVGFVALSFPITSIVDGALGSVIGTSFMRRFLITPSLTSMHYLSFFRSNPKARLGHSILAPFIDYPYESVPARVVGRNFYGSSAVNENSNLWMDGYANFGAVGFLLATILLAVLLLVVNSVTTSIATRKVGLLMLVMPALGLSNAALLTTLLNGGMLIVIGLLFLWPEFDRADNGSRGDPHPGADSSATGGPAPSAPKLVLVSDGE